MQRNLCLLPALVHESLFCVRSTHADTKQQLHERSEWRRFGHRHKEAAATTLQPDGLQRPVFVSCTCVRHRGRNDKKYLAKHLPSSVHLLFVLLFCPAPSWRKKALDAACGGIGGTVPSLYSQLFSPQTDGTNTRGRQNAFGASLPPFWPMCAFSHSVKILTHVCAGRRTDGRWRQE